MGGVAGVELLPRDRVLPRDDLRQPLDLDQPDGGSELAHPEVESCHAVLGLAVVAEGPRELEDLRAAGDEHAALAGCDRLGGVQRVDARVSPGARAAAVPLGAVRVRAILDQEDPKLGAERGDRFDVEGDVPADVDDEGRLRLAPGGLFFEVGKARAEVLTVAVDERHPGAEGSAASGVAMNVFDGQRTTSPRPTPANCKAASAPPLQLESATAPAPFQRSQAVSKRSVSGPSVHRSESRTSSISACSRGRSRWSKPIAKREKSRCSAGVVVIV